MSKAVKVCAIITLAAVMAGCATTGGGVPPEEQIRAKLDPWSQAFVAQEIPTVMKFYSEDFTHYEYGDKAGLQSFLEDNLSYLNDAEVDMAPMTVTVDGDTAKAGPIGLTAAFGSAVINLDLKKEDKDWMIVGMDVQMQ